MTYCIKTLHCTWEISNPFHPHKPLSNQWTASLGIPEEIPSEISLEFSHGISPRDSSSNLFMNCFKDASKDYLRNFSSDLFMVSCRIAFRDFSWIFSNYFFRDFKRDLNKSLWILSVAPSEIHVIFQEFFLEFVEIFCRIFEIS